MLVTNYAENIKRTCGGEMWKLKMQSRERRSIQDTMQESIQKQLGEIQSLKKQAKKDGGQSNERGG